MSADQAASREIIRILHEIDSWLGFIATLLGITFLLALWITLLLSKK